MHQISHSPSNNHGRISETKTSDQSISDLLKWPKRNKHQQILLGIYSKKVLYAEDNQRSTCLTLSTSAMGSSLEENRQITRMGTKQVTVQIVQAVDLLIATIRHSAQNTNSNQLSRSFLPLETKKKTKLNLEWSLFTTLWGWSKDLRKLQSTGKIERTASQAPTSCLAKNTSRNKRKSFLVTSLENVISHQK